MNLSPCADGSKQQNGILTWSGAWLTEPNTGLLGFHLGCILLSKSRINGICHLELWVQLQSDDAFDIVIGVDTYRNFYIAVALTPSSCNLDDYRIPTIQQGYQALIG
jgi:hypothetical protein